MRLTLDPRGEQLVVAQLRTGRYHSPEEAVAEAVAHIRESRKGVTLGGLKIKDLIHEGHKY